MLQQILVFALLISAVVFLIRTVYISFRTGKTCASNCGKCAVTETTKIPQ
ncbi:MAG: FeoB-associated Cys-rich membrane protein [Cyclobacteriaceae bacterium]